MIFTTPQFALFLVIFLTVYWALRGQPRKLFLLAASYLFYGSWNAKFLLLIIGSTLLDFYVARAITRHDDRPRRRHLLLLSVIGNLGVLAIFKYFNFFVDAAATALEALGWPVNRIVLQVLLPVGISFYTFQTMSYTIDVYRGRIDVCTSLLDFALYVAFFPQLVAGPIERAHHLLPQLRDLDRPSLASGWGLIALGAFKKVAIADRMAGLVAATYATPAETHAAALWLGTYAFAIQIYCDFSGYSDIAVGLARLLGIDVIQNFRSPYAADGPSDFWRRWHFSLSTWLRDYLYIPLGGNRGSSWYTTRNLMLTMLLGGLWHGAAWNYVLWGAYHGALLTVLRPTRRWKRRLVARPMLRFPMALLRRFVFFQLVCLGWALFRAQTLADCGTLWRRMLDVRGWKLDTWFSEVAVSGEGRYLALMFGVIVVLVLVQNIFRADSRAVVDRVWKQPVAVRFIFVVCLLVAAIVLAPEAPPPFIYFQF